MKAPEDTEAWIAKAEADYDAAISAVRRRKRGAPDIACFHAQQCIEKYLKCFLVDHRKPFPKTHDLGRLVDLAIEIDPLISVIRLEASDLTRYAIEARYPGDEATPAEGRQAVARMRRLRVFLREKLGVAAAGRRKRKG